MLDYIRRLFSRAHAPVPRSDALERAIQAQCEQSIEAYRKRMPVDWGPEAILPSEGFMVCALCDLYGVDGVVQVGVGDGRAVSICGGWREGALGVVAIQDEISDGSRRRLGAYPNVELREGEARQLLMAELERAKQQGRRVAVFIDGVEAAADLARQCIEHEGVCFVGVHDVHRLSKGLPNPPRRDLEAAGAALFSDEPWFVERYGELDDAEGQAAGEDDPGVRWQPGRFTFANGSPDRMLGSHGPTVGFLLVAHEG